MRARNTVSGRRRHKKILRQTKGFHGARRYRLRTAKEALLHALNYQYRDRRNKKRDFHRLWIQRIGAFVRNHGLSYSRFIDGLHKSNVAVNRKVLAYLAVNDPEALMQYVDIARQSLKNET